MARVLLAFDKQSARSRDADGRMRVKDCILSTAEVNPYRGQEIPGWQGLGLKAERAYDLYRHPEELRKGASTFNGVPLMLKHIPQTADDPRKEYQAGSVYNVKFDGKHLRGDLLVSDGYAIELIESNELSDLSCGYRYDPDMTSGDNEGETYDGIMRNIQGNHVALVDDGRASDAHVADAAFQPQGSDPATAGAAMPNPMSPHEERRVAQNEPPAAAAPAAAAPGAAAPGSPQGEMNEQSNMAAIGQALKEIAALLSDIHGKVGAAPAAAAPAPADTAAVDNMNGETDEMEQAPGAKDFSLEKATEGKEGSFGGAVDEESPTEPNQSGTYSTGSGGGQEGTEARGNNTPHDIMNQQDKGAPATGTAGPSGAMDSKSVQTLVANAVKAERARAAGVAEALRETRGVLGEVYGMDDAGAIYREALGQLGVNVKDVPKGTEKVAWLAAKAAGAAKLGAVRRPADDASHAMDAKAVEANQSNVVDLLGKIRILG